MLQSAFSHKVCRSRAGEGTRIWLEGDRLKAANFIWGAMAARQWSKNRLTLVRIDRDVFDKLPRSLKTQIAGTADRPIIDITGQNVRSTFPTGNVTVTYSLDRITIDGV